MVRLNIKILIKVLKMRGFFPSLAMDLLERELNLNNVPFSPLYQVYQLINREIINQPQFFSLLFTVSLHGRAYFKEWPIVRLWAPLQDPLFSKKLKFNEDLANSLFWRSYEITRNYSLSRLNQYFNIRYRTKGTN